MLPIAPETILQQRYRIIQVLGEGRFGRTYLAIDSARRSIDNRTQIQEYCTIVELTQSSRFPHLVIQAKEFFKQEFPKLDRLQHPQVPRFWVTFEERNCLFLVLNYIPGKTYGHLLTERRNIHTPFSEAEVWRFLLEVLPVFSYLHQQGVIHGNISPNNIIRHDGNSLPVLIDFGIVKEFASRLQGNPPEEPIPIGQPGYAPPEQLTTGLIAPHSDLYALAVVAIVLLTNKEPIALFDGDQVNWDWRKWTYISDDFAKVLDRMLSYHPEDRHQSANLVLQSLQPLAIVDHQPSPEKNWKPQGEIKPLPGNTNRLSEIPTKVVDHFEPSSGKTHLQTAITSLNLKSVWEKPQVFIPLGLVISLLAGISSWLGISHLLHNRAADIVSSEPPKQIDFKNPTIDTDSDKLAVKIVTIEPVMGQAIIKDGTVEANTPVRYRIAAVNGQNLDIQLISTASENVGSIKSSSSTTISSTVNGSSVSYSDNSEATTSPTQNIGASTSNQVLMTILSPTGTPIDPPASRVVGWKGQIRETGNYTIELRTIAGLKGTDFPYKLSVTQLAASNSKREPQITPPPVEAPQGVVIDRSNPIFGTPERKSPNNSPTPEIQENPPVEPPIKPAPPPRKPKPKPKLKPPINQDSATTKTPTAKSESVSPKSPPLVTPPTKQESTTAPTKPEPKPATSPPDQPKVAPETDSSNRQIDPD